VTPKRAPGTSGRSASRRRSSAASPKPAAALRIVLLGPQRGAPTLAGACEELEREGVLRGGAPIAAISAGWQEREAELSPLETDVGRPVIGLGLYARAESLVAEDAELAAGHQAVQRRLRELRRAYNVRLAGAMETWASLQSMSGDDAVLAPEREDALAEIRRLDARHLERVGELRTEYEEEFRPAERDTVRRHREGVAAALADIDVVAIAGGQVATLLNRLRLFGVGELLAGRTIVAWSAGAMVLGRRIVLFHDSPPWGPGNAEAFENGLDLLGHLVPFPHASRRLRLDDPARTGRLARRFAPDVCALLDPGVRIRRAGDVWTGDETARRLEPDGSARPFGSVAA